MDRRLFLLAVLAFPPAAALAQINVEAILNDPQAPVAGDPHGDVTIVAFLDYNCPYCRKSAPDLTKLVGEDAHVRIVYKDWPILSQASVHGAKLALAARYQGKYAQAHAALMSLSGRRNTEEKMTEVVAGAGIDMKQLQADLDAHDSEISALLKRNRDQAEALGLQGTPAFLIGPYKVAQAMDLAQFKQVVAQVRAAK